MMLFSSSNLAFSSTRTDTCFPFSAAAARAAMIGELPLTRYNVCLIARTSGSFAALRTKSTTGSKVSYGCIRRISPFRMFVKISSSFIRAGTGCGVYFGVFKWSYPSSPYIFIRTVRSSAPGISKMSSSLTSSSLFKIFKSLWSALSSISRRMTSPHCLRFNCFSISSRRSTASSSSREKSAFLMIRNGWDVTIS